MPTGYEFSYVEGRVIKLKAIRPRVGIMSNQISVDFLFDNMLEIALTVTNGDSQVKLFKDANKQQ